MNKQTLALIAVGTGAAIAAILVLLPSEGPVTVPKETVEGTATVAPSGAEFDVAEAGSEKSVEGRKEIVLSRTTPTTTPSANPRNITEGLIPQPGIPLDRHGQKDSQLWVGMYRMFLRDNGGEQTDIGRRVHDMATKVAGVTSANEIASYAPVFAEERALIAEVRSSTTNAQILDNCVQIEEAIAAVEAGRLHPVDKHFETADASGAAAP